MILNLKKNKMEHTIVNYLCGHEDIIEKCLFLHTREFDLVIPSQKHSIHKHSVNSQLFYTPLPGPLSKVF